MSSNLSSSGVKSHDSLACKSATLYKTPRFGMMMLRFARYRLPVSAASVVSTRLRPLPSKGKSLSFFDYWTRAQLSICMHLTDTTRPILLRGEV